MTADTPSPLVPKLRFAEFRDGPKWDLLTLSCASDVNPSNVGLPELFIYIDLESVKSSMLIKRNEITRDAAPSRAQRLLRRKDIIFQTVRPYQRNNLFFDIHDGYEYAASTGYAQLRAHECPEFLYQLLYTDSFVNSVLARCTGSNYPAINPSDLASIHLALPRKPEQQKIADCLGSLDDLVAAESRKLEALRQHKQGLMQQLFPRPGETVPRLRFPQFEDAPEWEEERLGNLVTIVSGKSPSQYALFAQGDYAFVKVEDLNNCSKYQVDAREYCNDGRDAVPSGSILFPKRGAAIDNNKIRITASEILIDTNLMALTRCKTTSAEFLYYYLVHVGLAQIADTSSIPQINNKHIIPYGVLVPSDSEQHRIADCLSMLDVRIAAQVQKLNTLKTHKQGLLQQLFPPLKSQ